MKTDANKNAALLRLLGDEDAATVALVKAQLAHGGPEALEDLRALEELADALAAFHLRDVIAEIEEHSAGRIFGDLCTRFGEDGDLEEAAWRLAAAFDPGEDFSDARATLDRWGREVARRLRKAATPLDRVETIAEFLNHEQKLRGTNADYDLEASLLPSVIESRLGIPISVSLVYLLVARRAGLQLEGVNLPGHFIVRHQEIFFDPYRGGQRIGFEECKELLAAQNLTLLPQHLAPATPWQILVRLLTTIYHIVQQTDPAQAEQVSEWIDALKKGAGAEV